MKNIIRGSIYLVLLLSLLACCNNDTDKAGINHVILVWLKADTTAAEIDVIMHESQKLISIATIQSLSIGTAITSERKMVDDSFSLGIHMRFANQKDMQRYLASNSHYLKINLIKI